ncbi:glycosyltransferase family 4 protein [Enterococcus sp. DIV0187]|uniref:glycosyltransferase family 4 protein n=1 Tax=Enterococcus sp. DIV0187 TaxID=2774644 RepID=UPI003F270A8E
MNTILYPKEIKENPYITNVYNAIVESGYEVYDLSDIKHNRQLAKKIEIINLNWFDSIANVSRPKACALLIRQILRVYYYKYCGMKIIYTLHNKVAHDTNFPKINRFLMKFLCKKADRIAVLCSYSKEVLGAFLSEKEISDKMRIVYLPVYSETIKETNSFVSELPDAKNELHALFFGMIRPYKNIEMLISIAKMFKNQNIHFVFAGEPMSDEYRKYIEEKCSNSSNITTIFRFIEESEIKTIFDWADIILLPLAKKSVLNSSSAVMAFSLNRTVIAPVIGTLGDYPSRDLFMYDYRDEEEHHKEFSKMLEIVLQIWEHDPDKLKEMGRRIGEFSREHFSQEKTKERYKKLYSELE